MSLSLKNKTVLLKPKAKAETSVTHKQGGKTVAEDSFSENVDPPAVEVPSNGQMPWCEVGVEMSYTKNLGNFNSARVGVSLKVPCQAPEVEDMFKFAEGWVNERMEQLVSGLE